MAEAKKDTVILQTSDDEQFTVERKVAERSALIKSMMEGESAFAYTRPKRVFGVPDNMDGEV